MEKIAVYCSWADDQLLKNKELLENLTSEITDCIQKAKGSQYFDGLVSAFLAPRCTDQIFCLYEPLAPELFARIYNSEGPSRYDEVAAVCTAARVLPFAPYLEAPLLTWFENESQGRLAYLSDTRSLKLGELDIRRLSLLLLAVFRLLSSDFDTFQHVVSPIQLFSLFKHPSRVVGYLAMRSFSLQMRFSDARTESLIASYLGQQQLPGSWEDQTIDYRYLSLWEERRWRNLGSDIQIARADRSSGATSTTVRFPRDSFSPRTAIIGGVLLPLIKHSSMASASLVTTPTTERNLQKLALALLSPPPVILVGQAGSGKTSLVNEAARRLGTISSMITLHLNEQTDAKGLLGIYTASAGTFKWQPGILTKAVQEGRWVLIEDLDRAPQEVLGVLLPLIEQGHLSLPSRKERIRPAPGFKLLATLKSRVNARGEEDSDHASILGARLWRVVDVEVLPFSEIQRILVTKYPLLETLIPSILSTFQHLQHATGKYRLARGANLRNIGLRDLLKWCSRIEHRQRRRGVQSGQDAIPEEMNDDIYLDAIDCFARNIPDLSIRAEIAAVIAQQMQLSPQRMDFVINERLPSFAESQSSLRIGREVLPRGGHHFVREPTFSWTRHASKLLEACAVGVEMAEPLLLVGETGIGKTTVIQYLAMKLGRNLTVINLSQQSESSDILGGFKPVTTRSLAIPMIEEFDDLFDQTFSAKRNEKFLGSITNCIRKQNYQRLVLLWEEAVKMADNNLGIRPVQGDAGSALRKPSKRRKIEGTKYEPLRPRWITFAQKLEGLRASVSKESNKFAFAFVEGKVVNALRNGDWVLLDEINLAAPDTLEAIVGLLNHGNEGAPTVLLSESGQTEHVLGHRDFRIFGAMNPATDAGKRDLPSGIRSRFTEIFVEPPDRELSDLLTMIDTYIGDLTVLDKRLGSDLAQLYLAVQEMNDRRQLTDGAGNLPHFSIRTLVRSLLYLRKHVGTYGLRRALYEGFCMSFLTLLSKESELALVPLLDKYLLASHTNARSLLRQSQRPPTDDIEYVQFKHYWVSKGPLKPSKEAHYIITPFVERNLLNLARAVSMKTFPILLQGPTSSGKTSMVEYLAKISGHDFVRINNHEHTDLQEYLGSYASDEEGRLTYREGVLVRALREGHWVVLDELNLAPTDVLEALNRLLDDNRELFVPETQETIRPHPNFMLFATQNPAGAYGGRKHLSRAFRNRFLELHFDDIPEDELEYILKERAQIPPSFCNNIVAVYKKLSILRQSSRLFEQRHSFATLRDLFRWALRKADDRSQLATNGYMLLAERIRELGEKRAVKGVIEEVMKVNLDESTLYSPAMVQQGVHDMPRGVVWTSAASRLAVLILKAIENNEPVLLIGETGGGKTQIFQTISHMLGKPLQIVNAHVNLETGDLIGAQRPIRNRAAIEEALRADLRMVLSPQTLNLATGRSINDLVAEFMNLKGPTNVPDEEELRKRIQANIIRRQALFEWTDGSLVSAMKAGEHFLLDEISLADDSVLERLNSVLEQSRTILLAEKGADESSVTASPGFQFFATMNPGGDYGKRELSAALRNRLTEIWVPPLSEEEDIAPILQERLSEVPSHIPKIMLQFSKWFKESFLRSGGQVSLRDLLAWVDFVLANRDLALPVAIVHGAAMVYIDGLGANPATAMTLPFEDIVIARQQCLTRLSALLKVDAAEILKPPSQVESDQNSLRIGQFHIDRHSGREKDPSFSFNAPTTLQNAMRIVRALQVDKPILLEGDPGVGKTTLVTAIAQALGRRLARINLSEQTDLMDLFGSDVPLEGEAVGQFAWRDGPFLRAMQAGEWVLLDEMNLASQSVLEGLNACLDHRKQVYITELDQIFYRHPDFMLFAAQNPHSQGGGRKGLPASFVNRFTVVFAEPLGEADLAFISHQAFPSLPESHLRKVISMTTQIVSTLRNDRHFDAAGGPWDINLRDIFRWLQLCSQGGTAIAPERFARLILAGRFRTPEQRHLVRTIMDSFFEVKTPVNDLYHNLSPKTLQVGFALLERNLRFQHHAASSLCFKPQFLPVYEALTYCVTNNWPMILVGPSGCGKTVCIRDIAAVTGAKLIELTLNGDTDSMDLVGGFEQIDPRRALASALESLLERSEAEVERSVGGHDSRSLELLLSLIQVIRSGSKSSSQLLDLLRDLVGENPEYAPHLEAVKDSLSFLDAPDRPSFAWTDGVLIEAMEHGSWVVLNNANLCNASVLDRLNSLMEPNGTLIVSEQHRSDGLPRIVQADPDFRIFITMDPKFGELSKAMRNRCVEVFLDCSPQDLGSASNHTPSYMAEGRLARPRLLDIICNSKAEEPSPALAMVALDHLSVLDLRDLSAGRTAYPAAPSLSNLLSNSAQMYLDRSFVASHENFTQRLKMTDRVRGVINRYFDVLPLQLLVNEPAVSLLPDNDLRLIFDVSNLLGLVLELSITENALKNMRAQTYQKSVSQLSVLESSFAAERLPGARNQSKAGLGLFIINLCETVHCLVKAAVVDAMLNGSPLAAAAAAFQVFHWIRDLVKITENTNVDAAIFQVYLQIGHRLSTDFAFLSKDIALWLGQNLKIFDQDWKLSFGKSLGRMWKSWRPWTPVNNEQLQMLSRLQGIMDQFHEVMVRLHLPIDQLARLRLSLQQATDMRQNNGSSLHGFLADFEQTLGQLRSSLDPEDSPRSTFLQREFETIAQYLDIAPPSLKGTGTLRSLIELLAMRPVTTEQSETSNAPQTVLQMLTRYSGQAQNRDKLAVEGNIAIKVGEQMSKSGNLRLSELSFAQSASEAMLRSLATFPGVLSLSQTKLLKKATWSLARHIFMSHADLLAPKSRAIFESNETVNRDLAKMLWHDGKGLFDPALPSDHYFVSLTLRYLLPATRMLGENDPPLPIVGRALYFIAMTVLHLMVPDRPYDPAMELTVERERYSTRYSELKAKLGALRDFEAIFTGGTTTLRMQLTERELEELGEAPPAPAVVRPDVSGISQIHAEFAVIVQSVLLKDSENVLIPGERTITWQQRLEETNVLCQNIRQMVSRLSYSPLAYSDLTRPVSQTLQCLSFAADLMLLDRVEEGITATSLRRVSSQTPLLGSTDPRVTVDPASSNMIRKEYSFDDRFHQLDRLVLWQTTPRNVPDLSNGRSHVIDMFQSFYQEWKSQLMSDQEAEEKKSRFYDYRGVDDANDEVEAAALQNMFPTFDDTQPIEVGDTKSANNPKTAAIRLAKVLADLRRRSALDLDLETYLMRSFDAIATASSSYSKLAPIQPALMLPPLLLRLEEHCQTQEATNQSRTPDFYHAANPREVKDVIDLVYAVIARFRNIREAWPEHATPQDVISCCDKLLQFSISDSLAKIITQVEKLHSFINEWQTVASREYSAGELFQRVTDLLIRWRRLELLSWSHLLDVEEVKVREEAQSWWFVLYEVLIAIPFQILQDEADLAAHNKDLADTLIKFLQTTSTGQFGPRLDLLECFYSLFPMSNLQYPQMELVKDTVTNVVEHFKRFKVTTENTLVEGRSKYEKDVKEQIQLASWKDTNVTALRDSARRSHHKLFKIVRKYRAFLAKPFEITVIVPQSHEDQRTFGLRKSMLITEAEWDNTADAFLGAYMKGWTMKPDRLRKPVGAAKSMRYLYNSLPQPLETHEELHSFSQHVLDTISELRKETPKTLNEENKELVQHLKTRKRKLLSDTIRYVRHMGVSRNLSIEELDRQNSLSHILATTPNSHGIEDPTLVTSNEWFHAFLEILPAVRRASLEHSDDLSGSEVVRSIGLIEGLVYLIRTQRTLLLPVLSESGKFGQILGEVSNIWKISVPKISWSSPELDQPSIHKQALYLIQILKVGQKVLEVQARRSGTELVELLERMQRYERELRDKCHRIEQLPALPPGLSDVNTTEVLRTTQKCFVALGEDLRGWSSTIPNSSYLLDQIVPWTAKDALTTSGNTNGVDTASVNDLDTLVTATADTIFVALQKLQSVGLPAAQTTGDAGWLLGADRHLQSFVRALHIGQILSNLNDMLEKLSHCPGVSDQRAVAVTLITSLLPVLDQYHSICDHVLKRYTAHHRELCRTAYILSKSFTQVVTEGFCGPTDPSAGEQGAGKAESGTGLGDGEGAEDISKEVADDEDLSEFAQKPDEKEGNEELDAAADAVDMDREDLEGELDDTGEARDAEDGDEQSGEEEERDIDEEAGSVDNLDPSTVDEKLWDGLGREDEKELENDEAQGETNQDNTAAPDKQNRPAEEKNGQDEAGDEGEASEAEDEDEGVAREEVEQTDPHLQQEQGMDLPEEMQLDGDKDDKESSISDENVDELSDVEQPDETQVNADYDEQDQQPIDQTDEPDKNDEGEYRDEVDANQADDNELNEEPIDDQEEESAEHLERKDDVAMGENEHAVEESGQGGEVPQEQDTISRPDQLKDSSAISQNQQEEQDKDADMTEMAQEDGEGGRGTAKEGTQQGEATSERQLEAFKKLGNVLERWHRQQREILQPSEEKKDEQINDVDMPDAEFEHLRTEEDVADTQALGSATKDQARALDQSKALEDAETRADEDNPPADLDEHEQLSDSENLLEQAQMSADPSTASNKQQTDGSFIPDRTSTAFDSQAGPTASDQPPDSIPDLSTISLTAPSHLPPLTDPSIASRLWHHYSTLVHPLSLSLTEQLRLILTPTLSSKLRGDYRTGKRLNIKRIIPYIASNYKRDKIWLRRSHPSKRNYQILLAVDDSKSMSPDGPHSSSAGLLALETVALLSKSLSMLEVGEISIVSFGAEPHIRIAHPLGVPFTNEAGPRVFRNFSYAQNGTNVKLLVEESIAIFRDARVKNNASNAAELWQLMLIISDGICENHGDIRRLVRQAREERIIIVFIIVDPATNPNPSSSPPSASKTSTSILDLTSASFEPDLEGNGEMKLKIKRYLDSFPFQYYLVVRDVRELPGVLGTALKGWFREVVESAGY